MVRPSPDVTNKKSLWCFFQQLFLCDEKSGASWENFLKSTICCDFIQDTLNIMKATYALCV